MRAITATVGLALAAGSMAFAAPALADSSPKPSPTVMSKPVPTKDSAEQWKLTADRKRYAQDQLNVNVWALRKKLAATTDPAERKRLEAALAAQVKAVPRGGAETGLADTGADGAGQSLPTSVPPVLGGLVLAGAAGVVVVAGAAGGVVVHRRRRRWLQPA